MAAVRRLADMTARSLVVKVTAGADAPERCAQAFTVAATAAAAGVPVSLWLTGESAWFALPGRAETFELPHSAPLADLLAAVLAGGTVTLCTQCAARRSIGADDVLPGIRIAGAATFVEEALADGAQALVY
jgi:predicted peroxiredoxin